MLSWVSSPSDASERPGTPGDPGRKRPWSTSEEAGRIFGLYHQDLSSASPDDSDVLPGKPDWK